MKIELKQQLEKPFFSRQEYEFVVEKESTPSYEEIKTEVVKKLNKSAELIVVKSTDQKFGSHKIVVKVYVYDTAENMRKYEYIKEDKKAEAPAEAAKEPKVAAEPAKETPAEKPAETKE